MDKKIFSIIFGGALICSSLLGVHEYFKAQYVFATEEQASSQHNILTSQRITNPNATNDLTNVKAEFEAVHYTDLYDLLAPRIRFLEKLEITNALKKELQRQPTEEEIDAEVKKVYMEKIDLERSFDKVKAQLDHDLLLVFQHTSSVNREDVIAHKKEILLALTYLERQYQFSFGQVSAKDIILYQDGDALAKILSIGMGLKYLDLELYRNVETYNKKIKPLVNNQDLLAFIKNSLQQYDGNRTFDSWFKETTKAYIQEASGPHFKHTFSGKMEDDSRLLQQLIPLLTLSERSIYVISTMSTVSYGLTATYIDSENQATETKFLEKLSKSAQQQEAFLDFWYRISAKKDKLQDNNNLIVIDTMQKYGEGAARDNWFAKTGENSTSGIREFIAPFNWYSPYFFADGQASGDTIHLFLAKLLDDRGQTTYTHEVTHILDEVVWFDGYQRREGQQAEVFARGLFEVLDNTPGSSEYPPMFNMNLSFNLENPERIQNSSPERFQTAQDLQEYMEGVFDVVYTLDYLEAQAILQKSDEEKAVLFNKLVLIPDEDKKYGSNELKRPHQVKDEFQYITTKEASQLHTINDVIEHDIVSGRLAFKGNKTVGVAEPNGYHIVPMFEPIYAAVQNNQGSVGDISFRRNAFELLAEYGYKDGMMAYVSNKYVNDEQALRVIIPEYHGNLVEFKKAMFKRRIDKLAQLKGTSYFTNVDGLQELMNQAVAQDLQVMKVNSANHLPMTQNVFKVNQLKTNIYQAYFIATDEFRQRIYQDVKEAEKYQPTGKKITITDGDSVVAQDFITNQAELPVDVSYQFKTPVKLEQIGDQKLTVVVVYSDQSTDEVAVSLTIEAKEQPSESEENGDEQVTKPETDATPGTATKPSDTNEKPVNPTNPATTQKLGWQYNQKHQAWQYFNQASQAVKNQWIGNYYLKADSYMAHSEWIFDNNYNSWFYLHEDGHYAQNEWIGSYYLKAYGYMAHSEWIFDNNYNSWFYLHEDGHYAQNEWIGSYYLKAYGYMAHSEWIFDSNYDAWYYLKDNGQYAHNETINQYYLDKSGKWVN